MTYLVTAALVTCAACLALTLDGVIADQWHVVGYVRGIPFPRMPTCNGVFIGMLTCGLIALVAGVLVEIGTTWLLMRLGR